MRFMTTEEAYERACDEYRQRRFAQAEFLAQQIRSQQPAHAGALMLMGMLWHEYGRSAQAVDFIQQAIDLDGQSGEAHDALAKVLLAQGAVEAAIRAGRRAVELRPDLAEAQSASFGGRCH
jgi:tetratricopeptide (TPR) repeat protein